MSAELSGSKPATSGHSLSPEIPTGISGLILRQITDRQGDTEFWQFQQTNRVHIARHGNTIDETPDATTIRRVKGQRIWFSVRKEDVFIGVVTYAPHIINSGLDESPVTVHEAKVGVEIADAETRRGYGSAALAAANSTMLQGTFTRIIAEVSPTNEASLRMCQKVGLTALPGVVQRPWGLVVAFEQQAPAPNPVTF